MQSGWFFVCVKMEIVERSIHAERQQGVRSSCWRRAIYASSSEMRGEAVQPVSGVFNRTASGTTMRWGEKNGIFSTCTGTGTCKVKKQKQCKLVP